MKYFYGNYDGIHSGLVAAKSKKQAVEIINRDGGYTSMYAFNQYWSEGVKPNFEIEPFVLYMKKDYHGPYKRHTKT